MNRIVMCLSILVICSATVESVFAEPSRQLPTTIQNPAFQDGTDAWSVNVYGAKPEIALDRSILHDGKPTLRIHCSELSDTALSQNIQLRPGGLYRFSGWVRTRRLNPHGAPTFGTFQIQNADANQIIASGGNHRDDSDWTEVPISFVAPQDGRIRIAVFFVGFGKGVGTGWFSDLKLAEVDQSNEPAKISRETLFDGRIDHNQYGQFIEYLCDLVPSMWAEKLCDGSFEGLTPYKVAYLKQTDFKAHPWYPTGATNRAEFSLDSEKPVSGMVSQRIKVVGDAPCTVGIAQDGIAVDRDQPCFFSCFLRQVGVVGPIIVRVLSDDGAELGKCEFLASSEWAKKRAHLVFDGRNYHARLTITFRGPGTLWIDNASLMPEKTVGGWRPDVVEAVRALKPGVIRFGGSALDDSNLGEFDWRDTIGDPDHRKPFRAWGGLQPTGPGLEEIVQFCRTVDAEPLICVRVTRKGPKDAADEVEYFNGAASTPMGRLRARNGHPEPYRIKLWQIGNERAGTDYESRLPLFAEAMKKVDPSIELLSSYPTEGVLRKSGQWLNAVCPHHYSIDDLDGEEADLRSVRDLIHQYGKGRPIKVGITEWNTTAGHWGSRRGMLWTLHNALACSRYHNLMHRYGDLVTIANRSNLINSFCSGIIQTDSHRLYKTPTYYAQWLYSNLAGDLALRIESSIPPNTLPDMSATMSADHKFVTLFAVNPSANPVTRPIDFSAFGKNGQEIKVWTLADTQRAGEPDVTNGFDAPERIAPVESTQRVHGSKFDYVFPSLSLTVIRWRID
jgi:alpha-N-arabinofuranosidase